MGVKRGDVLVGIVNFTNAKDYCRPQFLDMMTHCIEPVVGEENILVVGDQPDPWWNTKVVPPVGFYAEDMLTVGREYFRQYAIEKGYQKMVWQGVDAFWQTPDDFAKVLNHKGLDVVSPLITARAASNEAICRRFVGHSEEQVDVPDSQLGQDWVIPTGFPGADNIIIDSKVFHYPFAEGHTPWYERVAEGRPIVCVEENWILTLLKEGHQTWCDTSVKVGHAHDVDGITRFYKSIEFPTNQLSWSAEGMFVNGEIKTI